jgi:glycosyltransferase involved in cell wall biosynthesis
MVTRKIKIGLVVPSLTRGGGVPAVARFLKDVVLRDDRFELKLVSLCMNSRDPDSVRLVSPNSWFRGVRVSTGEWQGLPYVQVGCLGAELEFQRYRNRAALSKVVEDCDLLQMVCGSPAWANAIVGLGKPVSVHTATRVKVERRMRDAALRGPAGWWRKAMTYVTDKLDDRALRGVDAVQVMNPWMLHYVQELLPDGTDVRYAPPGLDSTFFSPSTERNLMPGSGYILCVGRLNDPRKNIRLLLEAYALFPKALREGFSLKFAGAFGPPPDFWERVTELGLNDRVSYVERPSAEDLAQLYREASIFALPSDEEGFGVVLLEAMSSSIPVVSTLSGGPDGIITEGRDGFLVPLDDVEALSARIRRLLESPTENIQMGMEARRTIEARYAQDVAGREFVRVWESLLEKKALS